MRVAVVDVGSNTVRLLVGERDGEGIRCVDEERVRVGLGADVERTGLLSAKRLARAAEGAASEVAKARKLGASEITVLVTSPGRQARNGSELRAAIAARTGVPVRLLSAAEEGRLGYSGAVAAAGVPGGSLAVCDAGGGSTQLAVGTGRTPSWVRSVDIGSLRLTRRLLTVTLRRRRSCRQPAPRRRARSWRSCRLYRAEPSPPAARRVRLAASSAGGSMPRRSPWHSRSSRPPRQSASRAGTRSRSGARLSSRPAR